MGSFVVALQSCRRTLDVSSAKKSVAGAQRLRCIAALAGNAQQAGSAAGHCNAEDADTGRLQAQTGDSVAPCVP